MKTTVSKQIRRWTTPLAASVCSLLALTGCGTGSFFSTATPAVKGASLHGTVHGGQQPVFNSAIGLYAAGSGSYGAAATSLLTTAVATAADGSFNITGDYTCPSSSTQVYLTATGGDPTGLASLSTNNTSIQMVAALGSCGSLSASTFISINELTTAAAAFALGQFFTTTYGASSTDSFGAPTSNAIGLSNAFATAHNLVNIATGTVSPTTAANGTNFYLIAADQQKLDLIANVIAACVNNASGSNSNCTTFFADATPTNAPGTATAATVATDTLQAAVYLSLNPTSTNASGSNINAIYKLTPATPPFQPNATAAPLDWTLAVQYSGNGLGTESNIAIDANGDVWVSIATATGGVVMLNGGSGVAGGTAGVAGSYIGYYNSGTNGSTAVTSNGTRAVAIDLNGKAWFGTYNKNSADSLYYLLRATGGSGVDGTFPFPSGPTLPYAVAIDSANNVFFSTGSSQVTSISATAATGTTVTSNASLEAGSGAASITITPAQLAYAPYNQGAGVYEFSTSSKTATTGSPFGTSNILSGYGSALDAAGRLWVINHSSTVLAVGSGSTFTTTYTEPCLSGPYYVAIDGFNNVWVTNANTTQNSQGTYVGAICEFNSSGAVISESTGFGPHGISAGRGIAVDQSGNVWVSNYSTASTNVTQIVGAAAPVVAPLSLALKNNSVATRP